MLISGEKAGRRYGLAEVSNTSLSPGQVRSRWTRDKRKPRASVVNAGQWGWFARPDDDLVSHLAMAPEIRNGAASGEHGISIPC
jgi:hypothetical protein